MSEKAKGAADNGPEAGTKSDFFFNHRCSPRILIVTDGGLGLERLSNGFGLSLLMRALLNPPWPMRPARLTLGHRDYTQPVRVQYAPGMPFLTIQPNFRFDRMSPALTVGNFDQVWLFGFSDKPLDPAEITQLTNFMNAGGGVFATGDHQSLGSGMGAGLPRVRRMRDWTGSALGFEPDQRATLRFDTIVSPGSDYNYTINDQFDEAPQRIYPNYETTVRSAGNWVSKLHPLLSYGAAPLERDTSGSLDPVGADGYGYARAFSNDIDHMPDHAHESSCHAVTTQSNFPYSTVFFHEFGHIEGSASQTNPSGIPVPAKIVAYSVAGGRAVRGGGPEWKPPVLPRLFGCISAFDGRVAAQTLPTDQQPGGLGAPGRVVCHSTWHHFIDANLDGTGSDLTGLRRRDTFGNLVPSRELLRIYRYYQNIAQWLMPEWRIFCLFSSLMADLRLKASHIDEIASLANQADQDALAGLGAIFCEAADQLHGEGFAFETACTVMRRTEDGAAIAKTMESIDRQKLAFDFDPVIRQAYGAAFAAYLNHPSFSWHSDEQSDAEHEACEAAIRAAFVPAFSSALRQQLAAAAQNGSKLGRLARALERA
jgi:hypothetical protein